MAENDPWKNGNNKHEQRPEVDKGRQAEREGFEKANNGGNLSEGYQPTKDVDSQPPTGGSGVPDKKGD